MLFLLLFGYCVLTAHGSLYELGRGEFLDAIDTSNIIGTFNAASNLSYSFDSTSECSPFYSAEIVVPPHATDYTATVKLIGSSGQAVWIPIQEKGTVENVAVQGPKFPLIAHTTYFNKETCMESLVVRVKDDFGMASRDKSFLTIPYQYIATCLKINDKLKVDQVDEAWNCLNVGGKWLRAINIKVPNRVSLKHQLQKVNSATGVQKELYLRQACEHVLPLYSGGTDSWHNQICSVNSQTVIPDTSIASVGIVPSLQVTVSLAVLYFTFLNAV